MTELVVPDWAGRIAHKAHELHKKHCKSPIAVGVIERLATDPRMRVVWDQLGKQSRENHRPTGKPFYKLAKRFTDIGHDNAIVGLFEFAVNIGRLTLALPSAHEPDHPFQPLADRLKAEAKLLLGKDIASSDFRIHHSWRTEGLVGLRDGTRRPQERTHNDRRHRLRASR